MFSKLAQIRSYITHAITSLESQRPQLPSDPALPRKLSFMLDHVLKAPLPAQFKAYHELQAPEVALNELMPQLYHSSEVTTQQVTAILHFYTFLLLNCQNELVLCKIVSDAFVLELSEILPSRLHSLGESPLVDVEEVNSYKIALVKAYVSRLGTETIKYMVVNDRLRIYESCVSFCVEFQGRQEWGVEITCMGNCLLLILKFAAERQEYTPLCFQENGTARLLTHLASLIHASIEDMLKVSSNFEEQLESLRSAILFTVDLIGSIGQGEYRESLISISFGKLRDLRWLFGQLVEHFTGKQTSQADYLQILELIKVLLKLLGIYFKSQELVGLLERSLIPILDKFILTFSAAVAPSLQNKQQRLENKKLLHLFCSVSEILAMILQEGGYLVRRKTAGKEEKQLKALVVTRIVDIIELLLGQDATAVAQQVCAKSVKLILLSLMQLTVENYHTLHEYSVLRLHQYFISHLKKVLKNCDIWDYVVLNYQSLLKQTSQSLLNVDPTDPTEYQHCQSHDPYRTRQSSPSQIALNAILLNEYARSFRFMIVEATGVGTSSIKLEKSYHTNFISAGWSLQPGKDLQGEVTELGRLVHLSNDVHVPIAIVVDEECLIFAHIEEDKPRKVILNIRYKMVEGFCLEKEVLRIKLKGAQEILVQGERAQIDRFKGYLIDKRDKARQRELKFIYQSLELYYQDNLTVISSIGEKEIQPETQESVPPQQLPEDTAQQQTVSKQQEEKSSAEEPSPVLL